MAWGVGLNASLVRVERGVAACVRKGRGRRPQESRGVNRGNPRPANQTNQPTGGNGRTQEKPLGLLMLRSMHIIQQRLKGYCTTRTSSTILKYRHSGMKYDAASIAPAAGSD